MAMMTCSRCNQWRDLDQFKLDAKSISGIRRTCKSCDAKVSREYRARRKAVLAASSHSAPKMVVVLNDVHVPEHDRKFWSVVLSWLKANKPDELVLGGDFGEYASVSQHGGANEAKLVEDLAEVKVALDQLREAVGSDCRMTYLEGNHESRLPRAISSWAPTFAGAVDLPTALEFDRRGIEWVPEYSQPIIRGNLRILHGHQMLGKYGPKHHAAKAADVYGSQPHVEIIYGHVHAAQTATKPVAGGSIAATSTGCGRTIGADKVRWLAGRESGWHHGFAVAYVATDLAQVYTVKVRDGRFVWNGTVYDCRTPPSV